MDNHFGGIVWTNHALDRMRERGIKQGDAWATWSSPESSRKGKLSGVFIYYRNWNGTQIEVVTKKNEKKEWVVLSVWARPIASKSPTGSSKVGFWRALYNFIFSKK